MKYEKFLKQLCQKAHASLFWADFHADQTLKPEEGENIFQQIFHVERSIWHVKQSTKAYDWIGQALQVPKSFVEKSKRSSALAVLNEWVKENVVEKNE